MYTSITLSQDQIKLDEIFRTFEVAPSQGAINIFVGLVRDSNTGKKVKWIEYDAYSELCYKILFDIVSQARERWDPNAHLLIVHRTGRVMTNEASIAIAVSSQHRDESYQISRYVIEEIKKRAPIWKNEFYEEGGSCWLQGNRLVHQSEVEFEKDRTPSCRG